MNIKINSLIVASILVTLAFGELKAQTIYDAYKFSWQTQEGTARSMAMGNASVALGGDLGTISINPASTGVFRFSEASFTPSLSFNSSKADYLGTRSSNNRTRFGVSNFGYVGTFETGRTNRGLINWNLGVVYNKVNDFNSRMSASGKTSSSSWLSAMAANTDGTDAKSMDITDNYNPFFSSRAPWSAILSWNTSLIDTLSTPSGMQGNLFKGATENIDGSVFKIGGELNQNFVKESSGNVAEVILNFGGNISDKLFFGVNVGIQSIWYKYYEEYSESATDSRNFQTGFNSFSKSYNIRTSGTGVNLKAGLIYLPVAGLRLGASISTPTWMYLHDEWEENIVADFSAINGKPAYFQKLASPLGVFDYRLNTPFRWNVGAAYTFGKIGVLSVDFEQTDYSNMKLLEKDRPNTFNTENSDIRNTFTTSNIIRAGGEIRFTPAFALRAGYQYYTQGEKNNNNDIHLGSIGLGYNSPNGFFIDMAYQRQFKDSKSTFSLYSDTEFTQAPVGNEKWLNSKLILTVGFRF